VTTRPELIEATDEEIEDAVKYADPMALRGLIFQLTGDESIAATDVTKSRIFFAEAFSLSNSLDVDMIRAKAAEFLKSYRDQGAGDIGFGPSERLQQSLGLSAGEAINPSELDMWLEELALDPWKRALKWQEAPDEKKLKAFSVIVIGAGLGGINAAVQLKHAGIPYTVIEKNSGVGGTWFENRYPGARVDSPSRAYTHIFGADYIFPNPFSSQAENEKYFNWVADKYKIRGDINFNTEVKSAVWDEDAGVWEIKAVGPDGERYFRANAVICAAGFLARPNVPSIDGMADFEGPSFHTARWPKDLDLEGKRVAVIGTGATGYQLVPELANLAEHVYLFQRTPQWVFEVPGYRHPFPPQLTWLDRNLPYHSNFMRFRTNWITGQHVFSHVFNIDPDWTDPLTRSPHNKEVRDARVAYINQKFAKRPDIAEKMIPPHPPFSARPLLVDADYNIYDAIQRDDVTLVTGGIKQITTDRIVVGGEEYVVDVIVYATGFRANDFLWPMEVRGRKGTRVEDLWERDGARAYIGTMLPGFPNFFMLYGPNTNPIGGGIINHEEMMTRFALKRIEQLISSGKKRVDVTLDGYWRYNEEVDRREARKIYTDTRAHNYYKNKFGRSSAMCPFVPSELWSWLQHPNFEEIIIE
jgi:4-hydroxyacetophenone monooxygenase